MTEEQKWNARKGDTAEERIRYWAWDGNPPPRPTTMRWIGYDEPMWFWGAWEFGVFDDGWILSHRRIVKLQGKWPRYRKIAHD